MIFPVLVRTMILSSILMGIFFGSTPAEAKLAPYDGIGGNGGTPFRLDCGDYGVLVGLNGRSGVVVDRVTGLCVKIDPVSGIWIGGVYETNPAGGFGGGPFRKICPLGQGLTRIRCRSQPQGPRNGHAKPGVANGNRPQSGERKSIGTSGFVIGTELVLGGVGSKGAQRIDQTRGKWEVTKTEAVIQPTTNRRDV